MEVQGLRVAVLGLRMVLETVRRTEGQSTCRGEMGTGIAWEEGGGKGQRNKEIQRKRHGQGLEGGHKERHGKRLGEGAGEGE
jgi:hypothetical protein